MISLNTTINCATFIKHSVLVLEREFNDVYHILIVSRQVQPTFTEYKLCAKLCVMDTKMNKTKSAIGRNQRLNVE